MITAQVNINDKRFSNQFWWEEKKFSVKSIVYPLPTSQSFNA